MNKVSGLPSLRSQIFICAAYVFVSEYVSRLRPYTLQLASI